MRRYLYILLLVLIALWTSGLADQQPGEPTDLLSRNVPDAFSAQRLILSVQPDSTWILYRGKRALDTESALEILGLGTAVTAYQHHGGQIQILEAGYRSRRVLSTLMAITGTIYLSVALERDWIYHIPGYVAWVVALERRWVSRRMELAMEREIYYRDSVVRITDLQDRVDQYNLELYQVLSGAGIHFHAP